MGKLKTPISSEDGRNYNMTWNQNGLTVSPMSSLPIERWPFKLLDESEREFKKRMDLLRKTR